MKYLIMYESKTGNTEKLAEHIYEYLEGEERELKTIDEFDGMEDADFYFLGFNTNRNSCSMAFADVLGQLEGKRIAIFGTCGMGNTKEYYSMIKRNLEVWMPDDYEDCGFFMCQGRMSKAIKERLSIMRDKMPEEKRVEAMSMYHAGQSHPDNSDFNNLEQFIDEAIM